MRGIQLGVRSIFVFFLLCAVAQAATTWYVAPPPTGDDGNLGTIGSPFATIQHAIDQTNAGDTVWVTPGTYVGARFFFHSGTVANPITLHGEPGAIVNAEGPQNSNGDNIWVRNSDYIIVEGFEVTAATRSGIAVQADPEPDESHGVIVRNNFCHDNGRWGIFTGYAKDILIENNETSFSAAEHGIYVSNSSDNPIIRFNNSHDNLSSGIQINADPALDGDGIISNAVIDSNIIHDNGQPGGGGAAINLASVVNSLIVNNLLYNNHKGGIAGWDDGNCPCGGQFIFGTHDNKFYNNTIVMPSDGRAVISLLDGSFNNEIKNNILIHLGFRPSINTDDNSQPGIDSNFNIVKDTFSADDNNFITLAEWQALGGGHDQNSILFNDNMASLFVDDASGDYHILNGSQAQDEGTTVTGVPDDLDGILRPQNGVFDIGCYELNSACASDTTDPLVNITEPIQNATVLGTTPFSADATDNCFVASVEFYVDGNLVGSDAGSPFSIPWDTTQVTDGSHALTVIAHDSANNTGTSPTVTVNVDNACLTSDSVPPTTSITNPTGGTVSDTIPIDADANDNCQVAKVEFYVDGVLLDTDTTAPYSVSWNTRTVANGNHDLMTIAYDGFGNTGNSATVTVNVDNSCLYCDDFENGVIDGWTFTKGTWVETGGRLSGTFNKKAEIISPNGWGGCSQCTVEADLNVTPSGVVSLLAWYVDKKNYGEITLFDGKNKVLLKRKFSGAVVAKSKVLMTINPNQDYHVQATFDGANLVILIDGVQIMSVPAGAGTPQGIVGFRIKPAGVPSVTGSFEQITVF